MAVTKKYTYLYTNQRRNFITSIKRNKLKYAFVLLCIIGCVARCFIEFKNFLNHKKHEISKDNPRPTYFIYEKKSIPKRLDHVRLVLERLGFSRSARREESDLIWSRVYLPRDMIRQLRPLQKLNIMPGVSALTIKTELATTRSKYVPQSFRLPRDKNKLLQYAANYFITVFLEKNVGHRGVLLKNLTELDLTQAKVVQQFVSRPLLVDGYKFDIGVYLVVTSLRPLRLYHYTGDVLLRYCRQKYYPFRRSRHQYSLDNSYRPTWEVPALEAIFSRLGTGLRDTFNVYLRSQGKDPDKIWDEVFNAIKEVFLLKNVQMIKTRNKFRSEGDLFELVRADLIVDEHLNVYLTEVNYQPNLVSTDKPFNRQLYEQLLYSVFSLAGVASAALGYSPNHTRLHCGAGTGNTYHDACQEKRGSATMLSADKNIAVWREECVRCNATCAGPCALCRPCLTPATARHLLRAYREHIHRGEFRRIYPPPMTHKTPADLVYRQLNGLSLTNRIMHFWYQGKCNDDITWCI